MCVQWLCVQSFVRWLTSAPSWSSTTRDPSALSESRFTLGPRPSDFPLPFDNLPLLDFFSLGGMGGGTGTAERVVSAPPLKRRRRKSRTSLCARAFKLVGPPVIRLELVSLLLLLPRTRSAPTLRKC